MERVGLRASPRITLEALKEALKGVRFPEAKVYFITDWQDRRHQARYALLIPGGKRDLLTPAAFGPAFQGGEEAHSELETTPWRARPTPPGSSSPGPAPSTR